LSAFCFYLAIKNSWNTNDYFSNQIHYFSD
jgi:hypothetical protein